MEKKEESLINELEELEQYHMNLNKLYKKLKLELIWASRENEKLDFVDEDT